MKKKVIVAMSGGVDSSVVAFLFKKRGYEVEGMFMDFGLNDGGEEKVKEVAKQLDIKVHIIDLKDKFEQEVIKYFINSYEKGLTPNPCVMCNREIKFGELFKLFLKFGGDYLATGHYVRLRKNILTGKIYVYRGNDRLKDQTYFLYNLNQEILSKVRFPLGGFKKDRTRKISKKNHLLNFTSESQDICFLKGDHNIFLKKHLKLILGPIKTIEGEVIGEHQGLPLYTIGQRRGIDIGGSGPYYVVKFDFKENILYVSRQWNDNILYKDNLIASEVNWISGKAKSSFKCRAVIRYGHQAVSCKVKQLEVNKYSVIFKVKQRAVTPGQSIVFYQGRKLLGGGVIS